MNQDFSPPEALKYFFGELSETELTAFEDKFFADPDFSDRLAEFEADLIDDYLRDELSATEKLKFEEKYLVSERRRERVKAAAALWEKEKQKIIEVIPATKLSFWESVKSLFAVPRLVFAVPVILLLILFGFIFFLTRPPEPEIAEKTNKNTNLPTPTMTPSVSPDNSPDVSPTPTATPGSDKTPVKTPTAKPTVSPEKEKQIEPPQPMVATIILFPSLRDGGEAKKVIIYKETKSVYLRLNRESGGDFEKYSVEVRDSGGNLISTQNLPAKKTLGISLPAKSLANGSYKITLKAAKANEEFKTVGIYNFLVEKK